MNTISISGYLKYKYWIAYVWLASLIIYFAHIYFDNGPITKYAQGIVDIINLVCMVRVFTQKKNVSLLQNKIVNYIFFLSLVSVLYYLVSPSVATIRFDGTMASSFSQLKIMFFAMTSVFPAIYFTEKKLIDQNVIKIVFYLLWIFSVLTFTSNRATLYEMTGNEFATNNMGYLIVSIFPLSFYVKRPIRYIYWGVCLFVVFLGAKRGALMLGASLVAVSLWLSVQNVKFYKKILFLTAAGIALFYFFAEYGSLFEYSINRFNESQYQNSARDRIMHQIIDGMLNGNPIHWFIGYGSLGSVTLAENFAHNDWLEFFADYGLLGLVPYMLIYASLIKTYRHYRNSKPTESSVILLIIVCLLYKSLFSMCFFSVEASALMLALGYTITQMKNEENTLIH